jgi:cell wall-associated NlpC family hydrolase
VRIDADDSADQAGRAVSSTRGRVIDGDGCDEGLWRLAPVGVHRCFATAVGVSPGSAGVPRWRARLDALPAAGVLLACAVAGIVGPHLEASARPAAVRTSAAVAPISRTDVLARARGWVDAKVPYSMKAYYGGYRTDCSGFVSMAWRADDSYTTRSLYLVSHEIAKDELKPGDALLWRKTYGDEIGHVRLFGGWLGAGHDRY